MVKYLIQPTYPPIGSSLVAQTVENLPAMQETQVRSLGQDDPLEKGMVTHSSILPWETPGTEELVDYSPQGCKESDMTEQLTVSFSFTHLLLSLASAKARDTPVRPQHYPSLHQLF